MRPSFDRIYLDHAINLAARSECTRLQVGCVIASLDGRYIFGQGYNGGAAGLDHVCTGEAGACFSGSTMVSARGVLAAYRRRYNGVVVRVVTREGEFTATANHPVLALGKGWVRANSLAKGDHIAHRRGGQHEATRAPNDYDRAPLEQVFDSLAVAVGSVRKRVVRHEFHGDAVVDEHVDVVLANGCLRDDAHPGIHQLSSEPRFAGPGHAERALSGLRTGFESLWRSDECAPLLGSHRGVSSTQRVADASARNPELIQSRVDHHALDPKRASNRFDALASVVAPRNLIEWEQIGCPFLVRAEILGDAAKNTGLPQALLDRGVRYAERCSDREHGLPVGVAADDVVHVEFQRWSGHVFNLTTTANWYCVGASATVVHNCGCLHAEDNAVTNCTAPRSEPKVVLVTNAPCIACATRLVNLGGVKRVLWLSDYRIMAGAALLARAGIDARRWTP